MSVKYNTPAKGILFAQGIESDRSRYNPAFYKGSLIVDTDNSDELRIFYSDGTEWISVADTATFAENANTAQFAFSSIQAQTAEFADVATSAENADFANFAAVATEAQLANTANSANFANNSNFLQGRRWESPAAIGGTIANSAVFTNAIVTSNLLVQNTLTYVNLTNLDVVNNFIILNTNQVNPLVDIGFLFQRYQNTSVSNTNVTLAWKENTNELVFGTTTDTNPGIVVNILNDFLRVSDTGTVTVPGLANVATLQVSALRANNSLGMDTQILVTNGTSVYWGDAPEASIVNENSANTIFYPAFLSNISGGLDVVYVANTKLTYVPATGRLTTTEVLATNIRASNTLTINTLSANGSFGSNGSVLVSNGSSTYWGTPPSQNGSILLQANNTVNAVHYIPMSLQPTGSWNLGVVSDQKLRFNPASGRLIASELEAPIGDFDQLLANGAMGANGQVLTSNGSTLYWAAPATGGDVTVESQNASNDPHFFITTTITNGLVEVVQVSNNKIRFTPSTGTLQVDNVTVTANTRIGALVANNSLGAAGQVLTSNSTSTYWGTIPTGSSGFTGSRGLQGIQGPSGSQGFTGSGGVNGANGFIGSRGVTGSIGFVGSIGFTGSRGVDGFVGSQGIGLTGSTGLTGSRGTDGTSLRILGTVATSASLPPSGNTAGDAYVTSNTGDLWVWSGSAWVNVGRFVGFTGSLGFTGSRGVEGFTGSQGAQGPLGFTGSIGFAGSAGPIGSTGFIGSRGFNGSQGTGGIPGFTGSAGVQGPEGPQGPQGPQGPVGPQGPTGATGFTGSAGAAGAAGGLGFTGSSGAAGAAGSPGATGFTGSTGSAGSPGATGGTGATGFTGSAGGFTTGSNAQVNSLGVGTSASGTAGEIRATNNITAYFSDDRLKTRLGNIQNPLEMLKTLEGFFYEPNETAQALGYECKREIGVSAQQVQAILPEVVAPAPIDDKYLTVRYEKLIPLLIEAIKELEAKVRDLENK